MTEDINERDGKNFIYLYVEFSIKHDHDSLRHLEQEFNVKPTKLQINGTTERLANGGSMLNQSNIWRFSSENKVDSVEPDDHLRYVVEHLEPAKERIKKYIQDPSYQVMIWLWRVCDYNFAGFGFESSLLSRACEICQIWSFTVNYNEDLVEDAEHWRYKLLPYE